MKRTSDPLSDDVTGRLLRVLPNLTATPLSATSVPRDPRLRSRGVIAAAAVLLAGLALLGYKLGWPNESEPHQLATLSPSHRASAGPDSSYDPSTYPAAASFPPWGYESGCPSPQGTGGRRPSSSPTQAVYALTGTDAKASADKAFWPVLDHAGAQSGSFAGNPVAVAPAAAYYKRDLLRRYCGRQILSHSVLVHVCPVEAPRCTSRSESSLSLDFLVLHRSGHWLVWFGG